MKDVYIVKIIDKAKEDLTENVEIVNFANLQKGDEFIKFQGNPLELGHDESYTCVADSLPYYENDGILTISIEFNHNRFLTSSNIKYLLEFIHAQEGKDGD